jgi:two-component system, cell cycle response regulator
MTTLVQAAATVRKGARASFGYVTVASVALLVLLGAFRDPQSLGLEHALVAAAALSVFGARVNARLRKIDEALPELEQGLLLLAAAHACLQLLGGLSSPWYPMLYVLVALIGSFAERNQALLLVLSAVAFEAPLYFLTEGRSDPRPYVLHAIFLAGFGLITTIFTQAELTRVRLLTGLERSEERRRIRQDARLFRLARAPRSAARDEDRVFRSSVDELRSALSWNLLLLKRTLGLHSAALLLRDGDTHMLRVIELASDALHVRRGPFADGEGAVGACYQRSTIMNLDLLRPSYGGICYYGSAEPVRAFIAIPVREHNETVGVLCADRIESRPFTPQEEQILSGAVEHLLRALENERVFVQLERSKREHTVLYEASQALGAALNEQAVLDAALHAAAQLAPFDFAAVSHFDPQTRTHSIKRAVGEGAQRVRELSFRDNASLTAMAVRNRHYLPYRAEFDCEKQIVYTRSAPLTGMQSLLILPLCVREVPLGTLAVAAKRGEAFDHEVRPALQLLSNQLAVALSNAASVARLEELATTDGLTGCFNKRHFQDELRLRLQSAQRFGRKLSLVIADIDHFKAVNDTYGHHVGDVVIRELGAVLKRLKRETDLVARFGGEEFCVLCEETGSDGAIQLAERVRAELGNTSFDAGSRPLKVTCSLGVATYPDHGTDKEALFAAADKALYSAKHAGRNQVRSA